MSENFYLKLRKNIVLEGDLLLAERELNFIFSSFSSITDVSDVKKYLDLPDEDIKRNTREGVIGYIANRSKYTLKELAMKLNFIQEIWTDLDDNSINDATYANKKNTYLCVIPFMAAGELLNKNSDKKANGELKYLTDELSGLNASKAIKYNVTSGSSSTQHLHSLHKYKAKFFPRLIRSFLQSKIHTLPLNNGRLKLLDPFVGSGTALIEASMLNIDAYGVDIDKLSCAITDAKHTGLNVDLDTLSSSTNLLLTEYKNDTSIEISYEFPSQIKKKFQRWNTESEMNEYQIQISKWQRAINKINDSDSKKLFSICLSDSLNRKFVIRMMGTGVGRFALEIAKTSLETLIISNIKSLYKNVYVAKHLISEYSLTLGSIDIHHGSAISLPYSDNFFSVILTSPPYLPASSGREDYLIGKAISNTALGLMSNEEIEESEKQSVGSMNWLIEHADGLPKSVYELYKWLENDPLRNIKAKPTLSYYVSLKQALSECYRVLLSGGLAIYVIGKESIFYKFSSREVLYKVECDNIFEEIALECGFVIEERINVELDKKNKNARPRSLDSYYETVFILKK